MLSGLPDRPLSYQEVESLNQADAIGFVFPATPQSIQTAEDGESRVCDLLITTGDTVAAVVYDEHTGWEVVGRTSPDERKEAVVNDVIDYRDYKIDDEQKVLQFVTELYDAMDELGGRA